jgi:hypothetical protein
MSVIIGAPPRTAGMLATWSYPPRLVFSGWLLNGVYEPRGDQQWLQLQAFSLVAADERCT